MIVLALVSTTQLLIVYVTELYVTVQVVKVEADVTIVGYVITKAEPEGIAFFVVYVMV